MNEQRDVSVVIGFKDWGIKRLRLAVESIIKSFGDLDGEVIVSDYGSSQTDETRQVIESLGARYVYTATDGVWSRSRALNAGFAQSSGRVLVSTDADMVFSPEAMQVIGSTVLADSSLALLLQCRDLPPEWSASDIDERGTDWDEFERVGLRRPRWGMGGMIAVSRDVYLRIRGYDERMQTYGGEDIDFAQRARRAGARLLWLEDPRVRMFHMWHPSTADAHALSPTETADVLANKQIMREDNTLVRNVIDWQFRPADARPLVSVVIATYNRSHLILDTLHSLQAQTVQDFEVVVVDDGSEDDTRRVVESLKDARIRYVRQSNAGVAVARNRGVDESRGYYVAVLDDDDIALPWRLEAHFAALETGTHGTFGAFVNFDDTTGDLALHQTKQFTTETTADKGGAPGHSTWMLDRDLMAAIRYDESLPSGIDNNFALRSLRSGVTWKHTGKVHTLRRMHPQQITALDSQNQGAAARGAFEYFTFTATSWSLDKLRKERGGHDYVQLEGHEESELLPFLPDHLVARSVVGELSLEQAGSDAVRCDLPSGVHRIFGTAASARWTDLAAWRGKLGDVRVVATRSSDSPADEVGDSPLRLALSRLRKEAWRECSGAGKTYLLEASFDDLSSEELEPEWKHNAVRIQQNGSRIVWSYRSFNTVGDLLRERSLLVGATQIGILGSTIQMRDLAEHLVASDAEGMK